MRLYLVQFNRESYYVEAEGFTAAIVAWRQFARDALGIDEEPESVACVHEAPVIR